jgi:eukaryotic-like serine/threonine-protein kinase
VLLSQKKPAEAELKLRECLSIRQKAQPDDWTTFDAKSMLGEALLDQKKYADAESLLLSGYEGMKKHEDKIPSPDKPRLTKALERLVRLYEAWDKKDKAVKWREELEAAKATKRP